MISDKEYDSLSIGDKVLVELEVSKVHGASILCYNGFSDAEFVAKEQIHKVLPKPVDWSEVEWGDTILHKNSSSRAPADIHTFIGEHPKYKDKIIYLSGTSSKYPLVGLKSHFCLPKDN